MPETAGDTTTEEESPSQASRRKSQSRLIAIAVSGSTNNALLTSIVPLFLLSLGASPFVIGIAATSNHMQKMGRVVGLQFMHRTGKAGLFFWARLATRRDRVGAIGLSGRCWRLGRVDRSSGFYYPRHGAANGQYRLVALGPRQHRQR